MMKASSDDDEGSPSIKRRLGGEFDRRIARDDPDQLRTIVRQIIKRTVNWPSTTQSLKGVIMGGFRRTARYLGEKISKWNQGRKAKSTEPKAETGDKKNLNRADEICFWDTPPHRHNPYSIHLSLFMCNLYYGFGIATSHSIDSTG